MVTPLRLFAPCLADDPDAFQVLEGSGFCLKENDMKSDLFTLGGETFRSRLLLGTAGYPTQQILMEAAAASGCEIVTVAIRRSSLKGHRFDTVGLLSKYRFLPNTAGCETAIDAIKTAGLAREALNTNWVKLEVIGDRETLYPDVAELIEATRRLADDGFVVLPYCNDDPVVCQRLIDVGAAAVMPMGSLIGSGEGIANTANLQLICRRSEVPVIIDAGIGTASDAVMAMELGAAAVMLNTAVAKADDPVRMAVAMRHAVEAGRHAHLAGRVPRRGRAEPSSPQLGLVGS
jgi:thiazole synthase